MRIKRDGTKYRVYPGKGKGKTYITLSERQFKILFPGIGISPRGTFDPHEESDRRDKELQRFRRCLKEKDLDYTKLMSKLIKHQQEIIVLKETEKRYNELENTIRTIIDLPVINHAIMDIVDNRLSNQEF